MRVVELGVLQYLVGDQIVGFTIHVKAHSYIVTLKSLVLS